MAPQQSGLFAHKSKQVNGIHRQLTADFHPAVKNVASAGQNLLRAYENVSRNHYVYTASLYALAFSSSTAENEVQQKCKELEQITEAMKAMNAEQAKLVDYFSKMTLTINRNCENEKERLKSLQAGFVKEERELTKAVERGKQTPEQLDNFYERELAEMRDQQAQRYRFFVEKHADLLRHLFDWTRFSTALMERQFGFGEAPTESGDADQQQQGHLEETHAAQRMGQRANPPQRLAAQQHPQRREEEQPPADTVPLPNGRIVHERMEQVLQQMTQQQRRNSQQPQKRNSQMLATDIGRRRGSTLIELEQCCPMAAAEEQPEGQQKMAAAPQNEQGLFRPIPILPESQQKFRHSLIEAVGRANGELSAWERQQMMTLPAEPSLRRQQLQQQPVLYQYYREEPPSRRGTGATERLDQVGLEEVEEEKGTRRQQQRGVATAGEDKLPAGQQQEFRKVHGSGIKPPQFRPFATAGGGPPVSVNGGSKGGQPLPQIGQKPLSPLATGNGGGHFGYHQRGQSQESTASSGMARFTPPIFASADHGRVVECTTPYEAQGDNQLSLERGERVQLVKSGTRGWVLGRSEDGNRHGWFPAKYLKLVS